MKFNRYPSVIAQIICSDADTLPLREKHSGTEYEIIIGQDKYSRYA